MTMAANGAVVDSATQTSDVGSDDELYNAEDMPNASPRVVIDTSQPFGSVEEAVIRFGGRGFWIPGSYFALDSPTLTHHNEIEESDVNKLEEKAKAMLKNLQMREKETHDLLKELERTKQQVEELKLKLPKSTHECLPVSCVSLDEQISTLDKEVVEEHNSQAYKPDENSDMCPSSAAGLIMMELKQAKLSLYQNTNELAAIRASVESLSKKLEKEKSSAERTEGVQNANVLSEAQQKKNEKQDAGKVGRPVNPLMISRELRELNYEADQFMKTAEAARSEVLRAMSDVEQTKTGLKVIEMRWLTAKKLEEAARAAESLALAEIRALSYNDSIALEDYHQQKPCRITLSLEEYSALTDKARKAESLMEKRDFDPFRRIEEATEEKLNKLALEDMLGRVEVVNRRKRSSEQALRRLSSASAHRRPPDQGTQSNFRSSFPARARRDSRLLDSNDFEFARNESRPVTRPTTSIGDILSRKLVLRDDLEVGGQEADDAGRQRVSLNQMLRQHRGDNTSPQRRREKDGDEPKHFFSKRKAFGFVHISLPFPKHNKNKISALNLW